jgi:hypothetical protein
MLQMLRFCDLDAPKHFAISVTSLSEPRERGSDDVAGPSEHGVTPKRVDSHVVTDRRWALVAPDGEDIVLCSAACALAWICYGLPADVEQGRQDGEAA